MTTTRREASIEIDGSDWVSGGSPSKSFVNPWVPMTVKHHAITDEQGRVRQSIARRVTEEMLTYLGPA